MLAILLALLIATLSIGSNASTTIGTGSAQDVYVGTSYSGSEVIHGFLPSKLASTVLWLDAGRGITPATGVSQWTDQISARAYVQATGSKQPTQTTVNGRPSLRFTSASTQGLATAGWVLAQPFDIFVVAQLASTTAGQFVFVDVETSSEVAFYFQGDATTLRLFAGGSVTGVVPNATTALAIYRVSVAGSSTKLYRNGVQVGSGTSGTNSKGVANVGQNFGAGSNLNGWISEIIESNTTLSAADAQTMTRYLGRKYNISVP